MTIRSKVIGYFLAVLLSFISVSLYHYVRFLHSSSSLTQVKELYLPVSHLIVQLQANFHNLAEDTRRFYFSSEHVAEKSNFSRIVRDLYPYLVKKKISSIEKLLSNKSFFEHRDAIVEVSSTLASIKSELESIISTSD